MKATFKRLSKSVITTITLLSLTFGTAQANPRNIPKLYVTVAKQEGVPAHLLYAISRTESTNPKNSKVWPWTINVRGKGYYFPTRKKAYAAIMMLLENGIDLVDIGLMQTNWYWHNDKLKHPWKALDPEFNIRIGARILRACYDRKNDWWDCAGEYHTKSNTPERTARAKRYRKHVLSYLKDMQ